jgi:hypothetical protein
VRQLFLHEALVGCDDVLVGGVEERRRWRGSGGNGYGGCCNRFNTCFFFFIRVELFLYHQRLLRLFLREVVVLAWERLGFVLADNLASIVFSLLIRTLRDEVIHIPTIVTSPHSLTLGLETT